jgi:hypothetical protein
MREELDNNLRITFRDERKEM